MKQTSTLKVLVPFKTCLVLFLTTFSLMFSLTSSAHRVVAYTPPCILAGQTAVIHVTVDFADANSWYHWQYRVNTPGSAPGPWIFLNGNAAGTAVNNTICGSVFSVTNANRKSGIADYVYDLTIANASTALNNIELRVLMGQNADPQIVTSPVWGGDDQNLFEVKSVRIMVKPATDNCYTNCSGNILVLNPPSSGSTPLAEYFGGFESGSSNFGGTNANGSSVTAQTDYSLWTSGTPANRSYRVVNNPDTIVASYTAFAPHSGSQMLVINKSNNATSRFWYKTFVAPSTPSQQYYSGQFTLKVWASKIDAGAAPNFALVLKGTNIANVVTTLSTVAVTMTTTAGQPGNSAGDWVQYSLSYVIAPNTYKKLEISIRGNSATSSNFAIDDICVLVPATGLLPIKLNDFKGTYANGISHLTWNTKQESNSNYFEIERSADAVNFSTIGKVYAAGFSSKQLSYYFNDIKVNAGTNYYRLKMMDKDGQYELSNTIILNVAIKGLLVTGIYPNPFLEKINIIISSENISQANIRLFDNAGKILVKQTAAVHKGVTAISVNDLGTLAKGFYILEIQTAETIYTQKLIK